MEFLKESDIPVYGFSIGTVQVHTRHLSLSIYLSLFFSFSFSLFLSLSLWPCHLLLIRQLSLTSLYQEAISIQNTDEHCNNVSLSPHTHPLISVCVSVFPSQRMWEKPHRALTKLCWHLTSRFFDTTDTHTRTTRTQQTRTTHNAHAYTHTRTRTHTPTHTTHTRTRTHTHTHAHAHTRPHTYSHRWVERPRRLQKRANLAQPFAYWTYVCWVKKKEKETHTHTHTHTNTH